MKTSVKFTHSRILYSMLLTATLLLIGAFSSRADAKPDPVYAGVACGTNHLVGVDSNGAPIYVNQAVEVTNEGGTAWQENTLVIYPVFDTKTGATMTGLQAYGVAISHKPKGNLYITYTLHEPLQEKLPFRFTGEYVVTGGTGLYAGATGAGNMFGFDFGDGSFQNYFVGTLVLANSGGKKKP